MNPKKNKPVKKTIFDVIESYYAAHLLIHLNNKGIFKNPGKKRWIKSYFPNADIFRFLSNRTDIILSGDNKTFLINPKYDSYLKSGFHIEKFLQAYGQFNSNGKSLVIKTDEKAFSNAFQHAAVFQNNHAVLEILAQLNTQTLLDLGCGTGQLLSQFCNNNKLNKAVGIDQNLHLCRIARKSIQKNHISRRVKIIKGNVTDFDKILSTAELEKIDTIVGSSILNEFFYLPDELITLLKKLKRFFPCKFLVVIDYYGVFNTREANNRDLHHAYIHDIMQILSGQGFPPRNLKDWNKYYLKAKCHLIRAYEGTSNGIKWFIHIVHLSAK